MVCFDDFFDSKLNSILFCGEVCNMSESAKMVLNEDNGLLVLLSTLPRSNYNGDIVSV